jgi:uncharacterized protein GlcG (DUF336 family)
VLIRDGSGALIGAVGISGDVSDKDEDRQRWPASRRPSSWATG